MRPIRLPLLLLLALGGPAGCFELTLKNVPAQVYFSPRGGCTGASVAALGAARRGLDAAPDF